MRSFAVLLVLVLASPGIAHAGVIFDNGAPVLGPTGNSFLSDSAVPQWIAQDFTLLAPASVDGMDFYGVWSATDTFPAIDTFDILFLADSLGAPGAVLASRTGLTPTRTVIGTLGSAPVTAFSYSASFAPVALAAGTPLWVSVYTTTVDPDDRFGWITTSTTGTIGGSFDLGSTWISAPATPEGAFQLTQSVAPVPEPSSLALLTIGIGGVLMRRKRGAIPA